MGTSHHQIARAQCSAPSMAADDHCSTPTRSDYARLGLVPLPSRWNATISSLLANRGARSHAFSTFSTFQLFDSESKWQATCQHYLIPMTSYHLSSLNMVDLIYRDLFTQVISTSLPLHRRRPIFNLRGKDAWHLAGPRWSLQSDGIRAISVLIGQYVCR